jgi:hypothetical protein
MNNLLHVTKLCTDIRTLVYLCATGIEQVAHHAFPALHKDHVRRRARKSFGNGMRHRGIKQQLQPRAKRKPNEVLSQT